MRPEKKRCICLFCTYSLKKHWHETSQLLKHNCYHTLFLETLDKPFTKRSIFLLAGHTLNSPNPRAFLTLYSIFTETSASYQFLRHRGLNSARHGRTLNLGSGGNAGEEILLLINPAKSFSYYESTPEPSAYKSLGPSEKIHVSFLAGIRILEPGRDPDRYSGYQVMRLATELVPTYSAILGELKRLHGKELTCT